MIESKLGLGRYRFHAAYPGSIEQIQSGDKVYINFPIESILVVCYDSGREVYIGFNAPIELMKKINGMSIDEVFCHTIKTDGLNDKYCLPSLRFGKTEFRFASVEWFDSRVNR